MNTEKIDELLLEKIMYALTLRSKKVEKHDFWLKKGFSRIKPQKLKNYWRNKINNDAAALELFETVALEYERHNYELLRNQEAHVWIDLEGIDQEDIPVLLFKRLMSSESQMQYDQFKKMLLHMFTQYTGISGENLEININIVSSDKQDKKELLAWLNKNIAATIKSSLIQKNSEDKTNKDIARENKDNTTPSLWSMAKNAGTAALKSAASGFKMVTDEQYEERKNICKSCEFWNKEAFAGTGQCTKCGCSTAAKLKLATEKCPVDKWLPTV